MHCATCRKALCGPDETFTGDACPECRHFVHPTRLKNYENCELIKRGGMGAVYRAQHPRLGTVVAIKVVHTPGGPDTVAERFHREARLAAKIPHPGVVRVIDHDCQDGRLYLVMEHVEGSTLREWLTGAPPPLAWTLDTIAQLADVLHAAHEQGIIHRDVKPENVMVDRTGRVRVLDFGISRALEDETHLTRTGEILGTPEYIAPEQILDVPEAVDGRADIHAVGVVLYELLTGKSPFSGQNLFQVLKYVESLVPPPPSRLRPEIPPELDEVVLSAMAKDRNDRPPDAAGVAQRLREIRETICTGGGTPPVHEPPVLLRIIGLLALVLGIGFGLGWFVFVTSGTSGSAGARQAAPAEAILHDQGLEHRRNGAFLLAIEHFEQAEKAGHQGAGRAGRITWLYVNRLYPALLDGPRWLAERHEGFPAGEDAFARGLKAMAENEWESAEILLAQGDPGGADQDDMDRTVLSALCRHWLGKPVKFDPGESRDAAVLMMAAVLAPRDRRITMMEHIRDRIGRLSPMRYYLDIAIARHRGDVQHLRAASELALVAGDAKWATSVFLACRVLMNVPYDANMLLALSQEPGMEEVPGIRATRCWLALAARDEALFRKSLLTLPEKPDPALARFQALRKLALATSGPAVLEVCERELRAAHD